MFGAIARIGSRLIRPVVSNPIVKSVVKQTAIGAAAYGAGNAIFGGGSSPNLPALPGGGGMPALPGGGAPGIVGNRGLFANDPNIAAALQAWAISKGNLRTAYRSPLKGYVVVRDVNGDPYALPKKLAQAYAGWKPSKKPPISVGEYQSLRRADRTAKKVKKIMTMVARVDKNIGKGGKVKITKKGGSK